MRDLVLAFVCIANSCNPFSSMRVGSRAGPCNSAGLARMLPSHRSHPAPIPSPKRCFGASRMALSPQSLSKRFSPTTNEDREEGPDEEEVDEEEEEQEGDDDYVMILSDIEEAVLFAGAHPGDVDANELIQMMRAGDDDIDAALDALHAEETSVSITVEKALSPSECGVLREHADAHVSACGTVDAMDGEGECQVGLSRGELEALVGKETVERLWLLPQLLEEVRYGGRATLPPVWLATVALRKYVQKGGNQRSHLGFHIDSDHCTANVNLSPPEGHKGGRLLLGVGGAIKEASPRGEGDAALHVGDVAHAVTEVTGGARYSLLIFYNRPGFLFQRSAGRFKKPSNNPSK